jgi:hypothetical protein
MRPEARAVLAQRPVLAGVTAIMPRLVQRLAGEAGRTPFPGIEPLERQPERIGLGISVEPLRSCSTPSRSRPGSA